MEITKEKPLIFNMLGEIEDKDSLVMTYDDLFGYMEAILDKKRMPQNVKLKIQQATHFIFLGMPLDKWYFHLLMRVLNMHRDTTKTKRIGASFDIDKGNATLCEEQYTLTFVQENTGDFTRLLHGKWNALQAQKTGAQVLRTADRWRNAVASGENIAIRQIFKEMKPLAPAGGPHGDEILLLEMQWNGFTGIVFETEMAKNAMKTKIVQGILALIAELDEIQILP